MCKELIPLLKKSQSGRIINFSSGLGQLSVPRMGPFPAYSMSKTAVNALTKVLADEVKDSSIIVTSVDPGWVATDMGGPNAMLSIDEGIDTPFWLATAPASELHSGYFYKERKILDW
jgi:NAD(P)-dependent dehydrogenase (short-subunit alcohol dehydrogenase family)